MNKREWILYSRSFLLTLGASLIAFSLWFAAVNFMRNAFIDITPITLFVAFNLLGGVLIYHGLNADNKKIDTLANAVSTHWASIIIMLLAYPVYLMMSSRGKK